MSNISFVTRKQIDEQRWNQLISQSNSLPYALTWYLDAVAENWDALVLADYQVVMPLVWLRKLGIKCLYQPYYCQQLGVFGKANKAELKQLLQTAAQKFPYADINLNPTAAPLQEEFKLLKKKNLLLSLKGNYPTLQKNYNTNHQRNIAKAVKAGLMFTEDLDLKDFQKFYLGNVNREKENFKPKHERIFKKLTSELLTRSVAKIFAAVDVAGKPLAAILVIFHQNRAIAIVNSSSSEGKKSGGSHYVFDQFIQKHAGSGLVLDFEGSSIPGIARFYEGFGATEETFYNYRHNIAKSISQRFF